MTSGAEAKRKLAEAAEARGSTGEWRAILRQANDDFQAGRHEEANRSYAHLIEHGRLIAWAKFGLGRTARDAGHYEEAAQHFRGAIAEDANLFWAHYELAILTSSEDADSDELPAIVDALVASQWEEISPPHVERMQTLAHHLWDRGTRDCAVRLLNRLWPAPELREFSLLRLVEACSEQQVREAAAERLRAMADIGPTSLRILCDFYREAERFELEIELLERALQVQPKDFTAFMALAKAYANNPEKLEPLMAGAKFAPKQMSFINLIVAIEQGDAGGSFIRLREHARRFGELPKFPAIRIAYLLSDALETTKRNEIIQFLKIFHPDSPDIALVEINAAIRDQRWDDAKALFDQHFASLEDKPQNVRLTEIDILAFSGQLEEAAELVKVEAVDGIFPPAFGRSALRILGELGRWDEVVDVGLQGLASETSIEHYFAMIVRAARKVGRTRDLFDALNRLPRPLGRAQAFVFQAVAEDLAELGDTRCLEILDNEPVSPERENRIQLKTRRFVNARNIPKDVCIYYCCDRNYLMPSLVSMTSLALTNVRLSRRAAFRLVVDDDAILEATTAAEALSQRLGLQIDVFPASSLLEDSSVLRTSYGVFTGGQALAMAAYYRIFYARHLVQQGEFDQALYVDADTIVRHGLDELFEVEMTTPLMARHEIDRPEVRYASKLHDLKSPYFNSGVLRLNLRHEAIGPALDLAIESATNPETELVFQDQCALNRGFDQLNCELPERFNYFIPPTTSGDGIPATDAVIVHFLDRPKPWDSLYRRRAREWFDWYDIVEGLGQPLGQSAPQ
jgi:lipopolysaccharide biosynthesis glycosyltransferase